MKYDENEPILQAAGLMLRDSAVVEIIWPPKRRFGVRQHQLLTVWADIKAVALQSLIDDRKPVSIKVRDRYGEVVCDNPSWLDYLVAVASVNEFLLSS